MRSCSSACVRSTECIPHRVVLTCSTVTEEQNFSLKHRELVWSDQNLKHFICTPSLSRLARAKPHVLCRSSATAGEAWSARGGGERGGETGRAGPREEQSSGTSNGAGWGRFFAYADKVGRRSCIMYSFLIPHVQQ